MISEPRILTAEDLWNTSDPSCRLELVRGELRRYDFNGVEHGMVTSRLAARLHEHADAGCLGGVVTAGTGFVISQDPDTVRAPDVAFVRRERMPESGWPEWFWIGPPDLAVETISRNDTVFEIDERIRDWLAAGTRLAWVVNPCQSTVTIYLPDSTARILSVGDALDGADVVQGFQMLVAELFERK